ncbi:hypothetical protein PPYR_09950 [Photinus pyralis]|uniref:SH3 domain-containing protein n=2 Tax=Photinus pyralis TaxID=7054 RepID=A0A5N4ABI1_PHOPY|nr:NCK-interacting protein with SH3 domain-like isoform X1 [Photinus pyralis]XP_031350033.1 NCK-interacting protein with SH3 domain-like isoform X1 [Photinus pyralis]XP_031351118.1 NCK-interacting protein with SH3 domain-like isoform X1 [Photinus pyralis]KAB0794608.1 hypothetical protein PPYR_11447 [Photinus pyralis]KAB0795889.1 hypothetical protein PPYR_09950 [Photinus pyralis]
MSNNIITIGSLEMLRSMYDFKATYPQALSFKSNEYFILHQTRTKHKNWWEVINAKGEMGFVPSNYVESLTVKAAFYLEFLENAIVSLQYTEIEPLSGSKKDILVRLKELKRQVEFLPEIQENSIVSDETTVLPPLLFRNSDGSLETTSGTASNTSCSATDAKPPLEESIKEANGKPPETAERKISEPNILTASNAKVSPIITSQAVYELVESVRINTQLSHEMSKVALETVIQGLHDLLPASAFPYLSTILTHCQTSLVADDVQIDQTHDASRLKIIFNELTSCKEDSQQRSWMLHEDEGVIKEYITELISILSNADASISKHVISIDHYHVITTLIQYYQMEVRWSIRQLLIQAFGVLCNLDGTVVTIMLNSVLPSELARDMLSNSRNISKLKYSSLLLTMIFSLGERMPITHLDQIGPPFLNFILNNIESPPDTDIEEQIPDLFLTFLLSFNLQFDTDADNVVLNTLEGKSMAKTFTEKILLLFNREEDPVRIFEHEPSPPHSLLKLFLDLFSRKSTADLFYTNDIKVLIDIVVRNISDLSPGDKRRGQYLELCRRVMKSTNYDEHYHRKEDILKSFTRIFCEESSQSVQDQKLVREIMNEFPLYFK